MLHRPTLRLFSVSVTLAFTMGLAGCNLEYSAVPSVVPLAAMRGTVMGGETPIRGANMILWETSSGGYGSSNAKQLATTSTSTGGGFSFTTGYTCDSGQFVYVTATGGDVNNNPSASITNNNVVLMAALGSCSNFATSGAQANVNILINELSTVAAAYALDNFITVNQNTAGNQLVYVGAPANNNAATGTCTGTGAAMTCTAAGLSHAFANAANLVDAVHYNGTAPTGAAFTTVPGNSLGSVPQAQVNALGDLMQYCTNSAGGVAGDLSFCGNLFAAATPSGGTAPADTLTAMMNIAKNPRNNVSTLFGFLPANSAFSPVLSAAPHDWDIAITYTGAVLPTVPTPTTYSFGYPAYLTLDANDNVYVIATNAFTTPTTSGVAAMSSIGTGIWGNTQTNLQCQPGTLATDTNGNVWESIGPSSTAPTPCYYAIYGYNANSGASVFNFYPSTSVNGGPTDSTHSIQSAPTAMALDRFNNLWYARKSSSCTQCMFEFAYTAGSPGTYGAPTNVQNSLVNVLQMQIDLTSNVYMSDSSSALAYVLPNTGTAAAPTYAATPGYVAATLTAGTGTGGISVDAAGNIWTGSNAKMTEFTGPVTSSTATLTQAASSPFSLASVTSSSTSPSKPYPGEIDGSGVYWFSSFTSSGQLWFDQLSSNTSDYIYTCYAPSGGTTCSNLSSTGGAPSTTTADARIMQVDSAGAVWVAGVGASGIPGAVVQILGAASPTWPQLSYGVFATKPQ